MKRTPSGFDVEDGEMFLPKTFLNFYQIGRCHTKQDPLENLTSYELDTVLIRADVHGAIVEA
jgi:hypothetical protein